MRPRLIAIDENLGITKQEKEDFMDLIIFKKGISDYRIVRTLNSISFPPISFATQNYKDFKRKLKDSPHQIIKVPANLWKENDHYKILTFLQEKCHNSTKIQKEKYLTLTTNPKTKAFNMISTGKKESTSTK